MRKDLTELELRLVECAEEGELLDLASGSDITHAEMDDWGPDRHLRADVLRDLLLGRLTERLDPRGVRARGVVVVGRLDVSRAFLPVGLELISSVLGDGLSADGARMPYLGLAGCRSHSERGSTTGLVAGARIEVNIEHAVIEGPLRMPRASLAAEGGQALSADGAVIGGGAFLRGLQATGSSVLGAVRMLGARIDGSLALKHATLCNDSGPALAAEGVTITRDAFLDDLSATGDGTVGTVRMGSAQIAGQLSLQRARIANETGPAFSAGSVDVTGHAFFDRLQAVAAGKHGCLDLLGARFGGSLALPRAELINKSGPAMCLDGLIVSGAVFLDGLQVVCRSSKGAVGLHGADLGSQLVIRGATLTNSAGPALVVQRATVGGRVILDDELVIAGDPAVDLSSTALRGGLDVAAELVDAATQGDGAWRVVGLTFDRLPSVGASAWLRLLRRGTGTESYAPQPYQQLALACREVGHDSDARRVLRAQRKDQVDRGDLNWGERQWTRFTGVTIGYGYRPWLALTWLLGVLALAFLLVFGASAADHNLLGPVPAGEGHATGALFYSGTGTCDALGKATAALGIALPLIGVTFGSVCQINADTAFASWFLVLSWVLRLAAWGFAALFVAGFTSAIRKP